MYANKKLPELRALCKEKGIRGYSGKSKADVIALLEGGGPGTDTISHVGGGGASGEIRRLNYIGSKYQLLDWIREAILLKTGWESLAGRRIADLFAGTGVVSHFLRGQGAAVVTNDAERYSAIIARAFTCGVASEKVLGLLATFQTELDAGAAAEGFITQNYAPNPATGCERMFFTLDNARRIDYLRQRLAGIESEEITEDERAFLMASILLAADAVSNVPAVYGCYLKKFKARAERPLTLVPVHRVTTAAPAGSKALCGDVLAAAGEEVDAVYLDPPYNNRHYSKNYFPLNVIAALPGTEPALHGKTGIPDDCFLSPFSASVGAARGAFEELFARLKAPWVFLSYSNEGTVPREELEAVLAKYGTVTVLEREYQRFKSFEYNASGTTREYLFCVHRHTGIETTEA
jgi:adenine-specific DNA-methyltransferase